MSVQSEYGRALESLLARILERADATSIDWAEALAEARIQRNPDLSVAARKCMTVLDAVDTALRITSTTGGGASDVKVLREPFEHLRAHCRLVLGIP